MMDDSVFEGGGGNRAEFGVGNLKLPVFSPDDIFAEKTLLNFFEAGRNIAAKKNYII
jgi:hypothetical protein